MFVFAEDRVGEGGQWVGGHGEVACWSALWKSRQVSSHSGGWRKKKAVDTWRSEPMVPKGPRFFSVNKGTHKVLWELQKTPRASPLWSWSWLFCWWQPKLESCHWIEAAGEWVQPQPSFEIWGWEWGVITPPPIPTITPKIDNHSGNLCLLRSSMLLNQHLSESLCMWSASSNFEGSGRGSWNPHSGMWGLPVNPRSWQRPDHQTAFYNLSSCRPGLLL